MVEIEKDVARLSAELVAAEAEVARWTARVEGLRAERDSLVRAAAALTPGAAPHAGDIARMVKADAIVAVLGLAKPQPLRVPEIVDALHRAGRSGEVPQNISVYLDGLLKQGRVVRVARGEYTVPD
ncbi:MAG: hypothetical protein QOD41_3139 [Cryptosporangiaceae bacterium]|jgi:hypothetical protein|nr:hypothetical protein [Cryptosporangiaceae bacterium]